MIEWLRIIPHPTYGNYGGAKKKCVGLLCPSPIDPMDALFKKHDECLVKCTCREQRQKCDKTLSKGLKKCEITKAYTNRTYAQFYRLSCIIIF